MALSRKHFKDLAEILGKYRRGLEGEERAKYNTLEAEIIRFCYQHNGNFNKSRFEDAIEEASK